MRRLSILIVLATLVGLSLPASSPAATVIRTCDHAVDFNLKIISARNMRCSAAERVMRRNDSSIARHFDAPNGFRCNLKVGRPISGIWRCTRGDKAFRFTFGD
jgi:hypothetical protein